MRMMRLDQEWIKLGEWRQQTSRFIDNPEEEIDPQRKIRTIDECSTAADNLLAQIVKAVIPPRRSNDHRNRE
jgi:hypothetical protein